MLDLKDSLVKGVFVEVNLNKGLALPEPSQDIKTKEAEDIEETTSKTANQLTKIASPDFDPHFPKVNDTVLFNRIVKVFLKENKDEEIDYPAHFIDLYDEHYIATKEPAVADFVFWKMLFQEKSSLLIKLNKTEILFKKTSYWPSLNKVLKFKEANLKVENINETPLTSVITKRIFKIVDEKKEHFVTQIDYNGWEDFQTPDEKEFEELINIVNAIKDQSIGPITVHCGAGIGRTGTFIAIHSSLGKKNINHSHTRKLMRIQRPFAMIETKNQFLFVKKFYDKHLD